MVKMVDWIFFCRINENEADIFTQNQEGPEFKNFMSKWILIGSKVSIGTWY